MPLDIRSSLYNLKISATDRFLTVRLGEHKSMLPTGRLAERFAKTLKWFASRYTVVLDCRDLSVLTTDVVEITNLLMPAKPIIFDYEDNRSWVEQHFGSQFRFFPLREGELPIQYCDLNLSPFETRKEMLGLADSQLEAAEGLSTEPPSRDEWELIVELDPVIELMFRSYEELVEEWESTNPTYRLSSMSLGGPEVLGKRLIENIIREATVGSVLTQLSIQFDHNGFHILPFHGHALHSVEASDSLILARPAILAKRTQSILAADLEQLETLLNSKDTKESQIQHFLEAHPQVLRAMGYGRVYSQVVLERDDGTSLRPDFMVEPIGSEWADIIDLKRPNANVVVGRRDRRTLCADIHEVTAQLREYAAHFEDPSLARRVENRYGIKCYRPRLVAIVGQNPQEANERELRRLMTHYADVSIVSFNQLLAIARDRLLI